MYVVCSSSCILSQIHTFFLFFGRINLLCLVIDILDNLLNFEFLEKNEREKSPKIQKLMNLILGILGLKISTSRFFFYLLFLVSCWEIIQHSYWVATRYKCNPIELADIVALIATSTHWREKIQSLKTFHKYNLQETWDKKHLQLPSIPFRNTYGFLKNVRMYYICCNM